MKNDRIYLDACCLNRPFDDQSQPRIALETQAILTILNQCQSGQWSLITSTALDVELDQTRDRERLNNVKSILTIAKIKVIHSQLLEQRSRELQQLGFSGFDATHIASAERSRANIFCPLTIGLSVKLNNIFKTSKLPSPTPFSGSCKRPNLRRISMLKTQQEIVRQGYQVLIESLGVVDALRFIQHFSPGQSDYTHNRQAWLEQTSIEDILIAIKQHPNNDLDQYEEIIE